jgi:hypothetical protein
MNERRFLTGGELRAKPNGTIEGYTAVFNSPSLDLGGFTEDIAPGAFSRAIRERQDVVCTYNHDQNFVLGRTTSGTLRLIEDNIGLQFACEIGNSQRARDVYESIQRGDVNACSFGFIAVADKWISSNRRTLLDVDLLDVGPVNHPAYPTTNVAARSAQNIQARSSGTYKFRKASGSTIYVPELDPEMETERRRALGRLVAIELDL